MSQYRSANLIENGVFARHIVEDRETEKVMKIQNLHKANENDGGQVHKEHTGAKSPSGSYLQSSNKRWWVKTLVDLGSRKNLVGFLD